MPEEPKDREGQEDEEFEPLDKFFAPIEDVDWPEEGEAGVKEGGSLPAGAEGPDEDVLPPPEIPDDPLAGVEAEFAPEESAGAPGPGQESLGLEPAEPASVVEPTAPLSGKEWEQLLAEGDDDEPGGEDSALQVTEAGPAYPEPEDERELTLDDLKTPPPEYADLPGPPADEPVATGAMAGEIEEPPAGTQGVDEESAGEPPLEDVEAAADHFAEAMREEEPVTGPEPGELLPSPQEVEHDLLSDLEREPTPPPTVTVGVAETLGGPSWQEPTSEEVTTGTAAPPSIGRNLPLAFLSGIILMAIGIGSIAWGKGPFTVVAGAVIVLAQGELYAALHRRGYQPATALGLVFSGLITAAAYLKGEPGALAMFALATVFTFLWFMAIPSRSRHNTILNIAMTIFPLAYVSFLAGYVLIILALPGGRTLMLAVVGLAVGYDIAAYAIGSLWGSRPLAPSISPRKSWEGAIGATLILLLVSVGILASLDPIGTVGRAIGLALVVSIFAPFGDLAESLLKRDLGVKDMGSIVPGHGGILDRVDSILFAAPAALYFFRVVFF